MSAKVSLEFVMHTLKCCVCGIPYGLPDYFATQRRDDHKTFYCPNGHSEYYPAENETERLRRELADTNKRLEFAKNEADSVRRQLSQAQIAIKKTRVRVARGVCPCCNRSFSNSRIARHIASKHPEYGKDNAPKTRKT